MLTACLLAIGNELLNGEIRDLNLHKLSRELTKQGFVIQHAMMTRDDHHQLGIALQFLLSTNPDLLICSGGLGPTLDDLTLSVVAEVLQRPLTLNEEAQIMVEAQYNHLIQQGYLDQKGPEAARVKMATLPQNAIPLKNPIGTAPGVCLQQGNTLCYLLPGVPKELDAIFEIAILPHLNQQFRLRSWAEGELLVHCDDEADLTIPLGDITKKHPQVYIKSLAKPFPAAHTEGIRIIATTQAESSDKAAEFVKAALTELEEALIGLGFQVECANCR